MGQIVLVDDDLFYRQVIMDKIVALGHQVTTYSDPRVAIKESGFDPNLLYVVDLFMDGMTGLEYLDWLKEHIAQSGCAPCIIAITSDTDPATEIAARSRGASAFLLKPFNGNELEETCDELIRWMDQRIFG